MCPRDIHRLFDSGYVTVTPDLHFLVSGKIKEEFGNGRDYYRLNEETLRLPENPLRQPMAESLVWQRPGLLINTTRYEARLAARIRLKLRPQGSRRFREGCALAMKIYYLP